MPSLALTVNHRLPLMQVIDPAPGGGSGTLPADPPEVKFDDAQQKKLNDIVARERKAAEEAALAKFEADAKSKADKATADAERKRQEEAGEFDKVRQSIEAERDTAAGERDRLKDENEVYAALFETQYAVDVEKIPAAIWDVIKPADDASLVVRMEQLQKAKKLAEGFSATTTTGGGSRATPKPGPVRSEVEQATDKMRDRISI